MISRPNSSEWREKKSRIPVKTMEIVNETLNARYGNFWFIIHNFN